MTKPIKNYTSQQVDELSSTLGEGITASLRKFCESEASTKARDAIYAMPGREWANGVLLPVIEHSILPWIEQNVPIANPATETGNTPGERAKFILAKNLQVGDFLTVWSEEREVTSIDKDSDGWMEVGVKDQGATYLISVKQSNTLLARPKRVAYVKGTVVVLKGWEQAPRVRNDHRWLPGNRTDFEVAADIREGKAHVVYTPAEPKS